MLAAELPAAPVPTAVAGGTATAFDLVDATGLATSRSDARRGFTAGEFSVNGRRVGADEPVGTGDLLHGRYVLVQRGKKRFELLVTG